MADEMTMMAPALQVSDQGVHALVPTGQAMGLELLVKGAPATQSVASSLIKASWCDVVPPLPVFLALCGVPAAFLPLYVFRTVAVALCCNAGCNECNERTISNVRRGR